MRAHLRRCRATALAWLGVSSVLFVGQLIGNRDHIRSPLPQPWQRAVRTVFGGWVQFDGWEYVHLAERGYWYAPAARAPVVFFPFYALIVRAVSGVTGDAVVAALVVAATAGLAAALCYRRWLDVVGVDERRRRWALAALLLYPYGWFLYGPVYSDSTFLLLVLAAFLLVEADRLPLAALAAALATATRPTGLALVPGLLVLTWERHGALRFAEPGAAPTDVVRRWLAARGAPIGVLRSAVRARLWWPVAGLAGVVAFSTYLGARWGNPLLWATAQSEYHSTLPKRLIKAGLLERWVHWDDPIYTLTITAQALIVLAVFVTAPAVGRRFGWGYATFVVCLAAIPTLGSLDYLGAGRYMLAAFPSLALLGERLADRPRLRWVVLGATGAALVLMDVGFAQSRMLS